MDRLELQARPQVRGLKVPPASQRDPNAVPDLFAKTFNQDASDRLTSVTGVYTQVNNGHPFSGSAVGEIAEQPIGRCG
jgi:hypothetical protein